MTKGKKGVCSLCGGPTSETKITRCGTCAAKHRKSNPSFHRRTPLPLAPTSCPHKWALGKEKDGVVKGWCRRCRARREFHPYANGPEFQVGRKPAVSPLKEPLL